MWINNKEFVQKDRDERYMWIKNKEFVKKIRMKDKCD